MEAARRAGAEDGRLDQALTDTYDRTVPHRKQEKQQMREVVDRSDLFDLDRYSLRLVRGVGDQVRASTAAKLLAARRGEATPAGMLGSAHGEEQAHKVDAGNAAAE